MKVCATIAASLLLAASSVRADVAAQPADDEFEDGLVEVPVSGDPFPGPTYLRPQLIDPPSRVPTIIGASLAIAGGVSVIGAGAVYVARQNYRLEPRSVLGRDVIDSWETMGTWSLWMGMLGGSSLVASEYLLLPETQGVPTLAWIGGLAGLVTAAVGVGYWVGGTHCAPVAIGPGAEIPKACLSGTADAIFGPLLISTALPLINWPLTTLMRELFAGPPASLTWNRGPGIEWRGVF